MFDVVTIAGSPSSNSRSTAVLEHVRQTLERQNLRTWGINIRDLPPEDLLYGRFDSPTIVQHTSLLHQARAVIIATPVYKAAYSGVLKAFLDLLPQRVLANKLVLPIATGGTPAHMLAIDYALRPVLGALGAQHMLNGVFIVDTQVQFHDGRLELDTAIAERLDHALQYVVASLQPEAHHESAVPVTSGHNV